MIKSAIRTTYAGVNFRSRLEASWAAFFDLCEWRWEYEPFELPGWIPDFSLKKDDGTYILVEVKPIEWTASSEEACHFVETDSSLKKVRRYTKIDEDQEVLILGARPFFEYNDHSRDTFGVIWNEEWGHHSDPVFADDADPDADDIEPIDFVRQGPYVDIAEICSYTKNGNDIDFCASNFSYKYRLSGHYDGKVFSPGVYVDDLWKEARNRTQWKPKK